MSALAYVIDGEPIPKARARVIGRRAHTPERTREYEYRVALHTQRALAHSRRAGLRWQLDQRYAVQLFVYRSTRHPFDIDNVQKAWADACRGILYRDDRQIDHFSSHRMPPDRDRPRLVAMVVAMTDAYSEGYGSRHLVAAHDGASTFPYAYLERGIIA